MHVLPCVQYVFSSELLGVALVCALARKGLMGEALKLAVVKAMTKLQILQIAKNVWIFLLIFSTHLCEIFFLFFFYAGQLCSVPTVCLACGCLVSNIPSFKQN